MEQPSSLEELLRQNIALTKENNHLLKAMRRDALIGGVVKTLLWIVLIVGSFYFSLKFIEPLMKPFSQSQEQLDPKALETIIDLYNGKLPTL